MRYDTTRRLTLHYAGHYRGEDRSSNRKENRERGRRRQRIVGAARRLRPPVRRGDVRDQRSLVEAANNSNAASSTSFAGDGTGVYEVGGPADPHRRRPDRDRQTQGPGVVGEDDRVPAQQPRGPAAPGETPAEVEGFVRHAFCYRGDQSAALLDPDDGDPGSGVRQGVPHDRELLRRPSAAPAARPRMENASGGAFSGTSPRVSSRSCSFTARRGSRVAALAPASAATFECLARTPAACRGRAPRGRGAAGPLIGPVPADAGTP
jgi:hypothetical protein